MRLVLVYQHFVVSGAGSTKSYDLARHLVRLGHEVTIICGRGYLTQGMDIPAKLIHRFELEGINIVCLGVSYEQGMGFIRRILSFLAFAVLSMLLAAILPRYDVLVASSTPLTVGLVGLTCRYVRRIPYVFEVRDLWPEVPFEAGYLKSKWLFGVSTWFEQWFYRAASAVTLISDRMRRRLIERGVPSRKVHFLPTGVDLAAYSNKPDERFVKENDLDGCMVAVYVGAHGRMNHLDYVLEAAEHIEEGSNIRLVLIGDGSEKSRLIRLARERNLQDVVLFHDPVPRSRVPGILAASNVALMMNSFGPGMQYLMTNKFFDYLAAGRPILVNVDAELTDWIVRADCGMLVCPGDPADLIRALRQLRDEPKRASEMGRRARQLGEDEFDRWKLALKWEALLCVVSRKRLGHS